MKNEKARLARVEKRRDIIGRRVAKLNHEIEKLSTKLQNLKNHRDTHLDSYRMLAQAAEQIRATL